MVRILITGASSGIGKKLAEDYAQRQGTELLLMGRDTKRLEESAENCGKNGALTYTSSTDVTDEKAMREQILKWDNEFPIDLIIANAGISQKGDETEAQARRVFDTNINGVLNTIYPLLPSMKSRRSGQIAIISSLAGFRGMPTAPSYSASKNAVRAFGDALRPTLRPYNIAVSVICPGFIRTPLTDENNFPMPFLMSPNKASQIIMKALDHKKSRLIFPWQMRFLISILALLPLWVSDKLLFKP